MQWSILVRLWKILSSSKGWDSQPSSIGDDRLLETALTNHLKSFRNHFEIWKSLQNQFESISHFLIKLVNWPVALIFVIIRFISLHWRLSSYSRTLFGVNPAIHKIEKKNSWIDIISSCIHRIHCRSSSCRHTHSQFVFDYDVPLDVLPWRFYGGGSTRTQFGTSSSELPV